MGKVINLKTSPVDKLPDDLMKISEFVKKYKCSKPYPYILRNRGKLTFYKIGTFRVSESEALRVMGV